MDEQWRLARKKTVLEIRAAVIRSLRSFFVKEGFLEVETPLRVPELAPESHIDAFSSEGWFLQTSPELCMKRLLAAGYPRLFQISKCFRKGERGSLHLPEFTMLEWYEAHADYHGLMSRTEDLLLFLTERLTQDRQLPRSKGPFRPFLDKPWERLSLSEAFRRYGTCSLEDALAQDRFDELLTEEIEPRLGRDRPTFLYDYPVSLGSLARRKESDPSVAERFELFYSGIELANGFSELTCGREQRRRFTDEEETRKARGGVEYPEPNRFLAAVPHLPESAGIALGIDRLVMLLCGADTIDEVVAFTPELLFPEP